MSERARISIKAIMSDIGSQMSASGMMKKYGLSRGGLETIFRELISAGLVDAIELSEQYPTFVSLPLAKSVGKGTMLTLSVPVPIDDLESSTRGILREVSTASIRVVGVRARIGEQKTFRIPLDMFMAAGPLQLATRCTSVETKSADRKNIVACFDVVKLTKSQRATLDRFMRVMFLSSSGHWRVVNP